MSELIEVWHERYVLFGAGLADLAFVPWKRGREDICFTDGKKAMTKLAGSTFEAGPDDEDYSPDN